ncbi:secreted protein, putative [Ixodes scapularis]|uniref:Secreted protein, putative n=1 Tax=Ixodes scapularis TaxID=6945 RepID=B7PK82_IXOSC|nr:secreted protein, putative [Ixodes scapularis]|eukprot:XP_002409686.1 secreted protein, putative [Ixodes scapularis]
MHTVPSFHYKAKGNALSFCGLFLGKGATVSDSNFFMDTVLEVHLPGLIRQNPSLYPETLIHTHSFEILSDDCLVRDLKVNLTEGAVKGLDVATSRLGTCGQPFDVWGTTTIFCYLELSGLQVTYTAKVKHQSLPSCLASVSLNTT